MTDPNNIPQYIAVIGPEGVADSQAVMLLARELMRPMRAHLLPPLGVHKVYELVNALAVVSAIVVAGTEDPDIALVFTKSFQTNLNIFLAAQQDEKTD